MEVKVPRVPAELLLEEMGDRLAREPSVLVGRGGEILLDRDPEAERRWNERVNRAFDALDEEFERRLDRRRSTKNMGQGREVESDRAPTLFTEGVPQRVVNLNSCG